MNRRVLILGLTLVAVAAWALDPPKPVPAPAPVAEQQGPASDPPQDTAVAAEAVTDAAPEEDDEELPPLPAGTRPTGPTPQRFTPTEKVRADFPISFPIDI